MIRGTTPKRKRTYPQMLTFCEAAFWQTNGAPLVVTPDVQATDTGCTITITLTKEQTLSFDIGILFWQIRGLCEDGAVASEVYTEIVTDVHHEGVIEAPTSFGFGNHAPSETPEEHETPTEEQPEEPVEKEESDETDE